MLTHAAWSLKIDVIYRYEIIERVLPLSGLLVVILCCSIFFSAVLFVMSSAISFIVA